MKDTLRREEKSIVFIDFKKVELKQKKLMNILMWNGVDWKERRLIKNL